MCVIKSVLCAGFSLCYVWVVAFGMWRFSLSYVRAVVCAICALESLFLYSLQTRTLSLRSEHAWFRSVGRERQGMAHDQFLSSKQMRNTHIHICIYIYSLGQWPNGVFDPQQRIMSATSYQYDVICLRYCSQYLSETPTKPGL